MRGIVSEPVAGKPYPERWPLRLTVYGGVVHAARDSTLSFGSLEWRSACGGYFLGRQLRQHGCGFMPKRTRVTCKACRGRLAKPISPSEAIVFRAFR
jgi:hypothetical protein